MSGEETSKDDSSTWSLSETIRETLLNAKNFNYKGLTTDEYGGFEVDRLRDKRQSLDYVPLDADESRRPHVTPLYAITAFFAAVVIIGPFLVRSGPNRGIAQACVMLTGLCMWIFWFTIYFGQMNPLMGPRLENTTVVWIAYKMGKPFEP